MDGGVVSLVNFGVVDDCDVVVVLVFVGVDVLLFFGGGVVVEIVVVIGMVFVVFVDDDLLVVFGFNLLDLFCCVNLVMVGCQQGCCEV